MENIRSAIAYIDQAETQSYGQGLQTLKLALADTEDGIEDVTTGPLPLFTTTGAVDLAEPGQGTPDAGRHGQSERWNFIPGTSNAAAGA